MFQKQTAAETSIEQTQSQTVTEFNRYSRTETCP